MKFNLPISNAIDLYEIVDALLRVNGTCHRKRIVKRIREMDVEQLKSLGDDIHLICAALWPLVRAEIEVEVSVGEKTP